MRPIHVSVRTVLRDDKTRKPGLRDWFIALDGMPWRGPKKHVRRFATRTAALGALREYMARRGRCWSTA
jgi:hypothetical protein